MCLAIPGRIVEIDASSGPLKTGLVDFDGVKKNVVLSYVPEAEPGDYVIVHVGFAISRIREEEAQQTFVYLKEMFDHEVPQ